MGVYVRYVRGLCVLLSTAILIYGDMSVCDSTPGGRVGRTYIRDKVDTGTKSNCQLEV